MQQAWRVLIMYAEYRLQELTEWPKVNREIVEDSNGYSDV